MISRSLVTIGALGLLSGCIVVRTNNVADVPPLQVHFASDRAARIFYEELWRHQPESREQSHTSVDLLLIDIDSRKVGGRNQAFNDAVARCDSDHDGTITEEEAEAFARVKTART